MILVKKVVYLNHEVKMILDKETKARGRKLFLIEGILAPFSIRTFMGNLMTAFALALGSNEQQIGILTSARRFAGFMQLLTNHFLMKTGSRRRLSQYIFGVSGTVRVMIALFPSIPLAFVSRNAVWYLISLIFIIGSVDAMGLVLKNTWMSELAPRSIRGRYFGLRKLLTGFSGMLIGYLGGLYVDYRRGSQREMFGFQSLFLVGALIGYSTLILLSIVPEVSNEPRKESLKEFLGGFRILFRDKPFVIWMLFHGCWSFATGFARPFFTVYLLKELQLSLATVALYTALGEIASISLAQLWGQLSDKYGNKRILVVCCIAKSIFPALWILATGVDTLWAIIWLGFVHSVRGFNSGQQITILNMALWLSPREHRATYLSSENSFTNILSAISPFVGGLIIGLIGDWHREVTILRWYHTLCPLHILFFISAISRGTSSLILGWVKSDSRILRKPEISK